VPNRLIFKNDKAFDDESMYFAFSQRFLFGLEFLELNLNGNRCTKFGEQLFLQACCFIAECIY
jgi:hypothetical protein